MRLHVELVISLAFTFVKNMYEQLNIKTLTNVKIKSYKKTVSTGNLTRHLRDIHQIREEPSTKTNLEDSSITQPDTNSTSYTKRSSKYNDRDREPMSKYDKWLLARDLALWFCKSLLPFDSVSDEGMLDFFKKYKIIATDHDIPSCYTISGSALSDVYESMLNKVKETISIDAALHFAITFDLWTDQYRRLNYITFKLHYLTSNFNLKSFTLSTDVINEKKTGERIKKALEDIKKRFALDNKNIVAVTDAGANVKRAVCLANMSHHLCIGHGLHNIVTVDGISSVPEIAALIEKIKKIVKAMRYRALELKADAKKIKRQIEFLNSVEQVAETVEGDEGDPLLAAEDLEDEILSYVSSEHSKHIPTIKTLSLTRWHSVLEMLESVVHICNRDPINNMLSKIGQSELEITETEWILLEDLVKFLKVFREAVEIMSSQKTCTMHAALVFRSEIIDVLNSVQDDKSLIMQCLKRNMLEKIDKRFPVTKMTVAAALLDCRFMGLKEVDIFLEKHNMTRTSFLSSYVREVINLNNLPKFTKSNDDNDSNKSLLHKLSKKHSINPSQSIQDDPIEQECWRYIVSADPTEPKDGDLLSYWNSKKEAFPTLSALAKIILCIPATSTPSERIFSVAGLTITAKRSRLSPVRVNKIIFIHDNWTYFSKNDPSHKMVKIELHEFS